MSKIDKTPWLYSLKVVPKGKLYNDLVNFQKFMNNSDTKMDPRSHFPPCHPGPPRRHPGPPAEAALGPPSQAELGAYLA